MPTQSSTPSKPSLQGRTLVIVFAAVTALLAAAYFLVMRQDYAVLYKDLRPTDAAVIVAELDKQHVSYRLRDGGSQILVPASQADAVRLAVVGADMPTKGLEGFELFNNSDLGLTDFGQKVKFQRAIQGELARTIMMTDGVVEARVHISMPDRALFREQQQQAKAAVTLVMRSPESETPARIDGVRQLVAAAVPDLIAEDVVVLDARGEVISPSLHTEGEKSTATAPSLGALVRAIAEHAIPGRRFDVGISHDEASKMTMEAAGAGADQTRPGAGLTVRIATETPLTPIEQDRVRVDLGNADIIDPSDLSAVTYEVRSIPVSTTVTTSHPIATGTPAQTAQMEAGDRTQPGLPQPNSNAQSDIHITAGWVLALASAAALVVLAAGAFTFLRIRQSRSALSFENRRRLVDQLKFDLQSDLRGSRNGAA